MAYFNVVKTVPYFITSVTVACLPVSLLECILIKCKSSSIACMYLEKLFHRKLLISSSIVESAAIMHQGCVTCDTTMMHGHY